MKVPSKYALYLSRKIGARGAGTQGESAAAAYITRVMKETGLIVSSERFSSWSSDQPALIIVLLISLFSYLLYPVSHPLSMLAGVTAWLLFQMEAYSWAIVSRLLPQTTSKNIIGKIPSRNRPTELVVLVANYDTPDSSLFGRPLLSKAYNTLFLLLFLCVTAVGALSLFGILASIVTFSDGIPSLMWKTVSPAAIYILIFVLLLVTGEVRGAPTAGANDNASGVACILAVLADIAEKPLSNCAVWGVATGRNAAGGRGMIAFLQEHAEVMADASIINLDHVGQGAPRIIVKEGPLVGFRASRRLRKTALRTASSTVTISVKRGRARVKKSDAMVARARGYHALTIAGTKGGTHAGWRSAKDTFDRINRSSLEEAIRFTRLLLAEIDREAIRADAKQGAKDPDTGLSARSLGGTAEPSMTATRERIEKEVKAGAATQQLGRKPSGPPREKQPVPRYDRGMIRGKQRDGRNDPAGRRSATGTRAKTPETKRPAQKKQAGKTR